MTYQRESRAELEAREDAARGRHCCALVFGPRVMHWPCQNRAKVRVDGKWYCGIHDPIAKEKRQKESTERYNKKHVAPALRRGRRLEDYDKLRKAAGALELGIGHVEFNKRLQKLWRLLARIEDDEKNGR